MATGEREILEITRFERQNIVNLLDTVVVRVNDRIAEVNRFHCNFHCRQSANRQSAKQRNLLLRSTV